MKTKTTRFAKTNIAWAALLASGICIVTDAAASENITSVKEKRGLSPIVKEKRGLSPIIVSPIIGRTISHHIKHSWQWEGKGRRYFFCDDPDCDVVYFGEDDSVILKSQLRTKVGAKELSDDAMLCYCFGVTQADALNDSSIKDFVVTQTKLGLCSCDTRNPSGRCCLKSFPRKHNTE
jgi:Zinc binding domain